MTRSFTLSDDCNRLLRMRKQELKNETDKKVSFSDVIMIALKASNSETFISDQINQSIKHLQNNLPNDHFGSLAYIGLILNRIENRKDDSEKIANLIKVFYTALNKEYPFLKKKESD